MTSDRRCPNPDCEDGFMNETWMDRNEPFGDGWQGHRPYPHEDDVMTSDRDVDCQFFGCVLPATHWVGNQRGERMQVCRAHLSEVKQSLVSPTWGVRHDQ